MTVGPVLPAAGLMSSARGGEEKVGRRGARVGRDEVTFETLVLEGVVLIEGTPPAPRGLTSSARGGRVEGCRPGEVSGTLCEEFGEGVLVELREPV